VALVPLAAFELVAGLPTATQTLGRVRRSAARVFEVADAPLPAPPPVPARGVPILETLDGPLLELNGVGVRYAGATRHALAGVELRVGRGALVGIVGASGSGKSTLAQLLVGFVRPSEGTVALGGVALDALDDDALRRAVGLIAQDAHVFDATLEANLRIGRPGAGDEELLASLEDVGLGPWVARLPRGLATMVGERGAAISGGQRQRIAVARGLLAGFPILVLDEPTEHLDEVGASGLLDAVLAVPRLATVLITHRVRGLEAADEILVLDRGRVTERGTHAALLDAHGAYARLYARELRDSPLPVAGASVDFRRSEGRR
jgi:ATP-binding cassette, subfamily C, bacterial CydCD